MDAQTSALIQDSIEMIVASRASVRRTKELLEGSHDALASSTELLERTEALIQHR